MTDHRRSGVSFDALEADLQSVSYPIDRADLIARLGERPVAHANGTVTLASVLGTGGDEEFGSAEDVREAVLNLIGEEAEGRIGYTDREPNARGPDYEQQSF